MSYDAMKKIKKKQREKDRKAKIEELVRQFREELESMEYYEIEHIRLGKSIYFT